MSGDIAGFYNARRDEDRARGAGELPNQESKVVSFRIDPETAAKLREIANERGCTVSDLVRQGATLTIETHRPVMTITWLTPPMVVSGTTATFDAAGVIAEIRQAVAAGELVMAPTDSQRMEELEERVAELERQRKAVLDACDEADMPVKPVRCGNCGPDVIAGEAYCIQCNATSWISAPKALTTAQIRDLLEEQQ